jgi:hypothetical protein
MHRFFKTVLLWLLMAALPIQGLAAVVKASCGQTHHALMSATTPTAQDAAVNQHSHSDGATHSHPAHATGAPVQANVPADISTVPDVKSSYCSACAACCFGAVAPPVSALKTPEPDFFERAVPALTSRLASHIPPSLERPPRYFLA